MNEEAQPRSWSWAFAAIVIWLFAACINVVAHRDDIAALALPDTDDAMRLVEVRDWLGGQAWGDVDQYRMNPPEGAEMHWSRLVDLPIAAAIVIAEPIAGRPAAERFAVTIAPLLALLFALSMASLAALRLAGRQAALFAAPFVAASTQILPMFAPLRVDHHGWQIALLIGLVASLVDPLARFRSGVIAGLIVVAALMIGLEMLPHIIAASAVLVIGWCVRPELGRMLSGYGAALALTTLAAYPAFVPTARWGIAACDAMSPVYLAALAPAGIVAAVLPHVAAFGSWKARAIAAGAAFGAIAAAVLAVYPQCAGGPMAALDPAFLPVLARISEARTLLSYLGDKPATVVFYGLYPFVGIVCAAILLKSAEPGQRFGWGLVLAVLAASSALMFVQLRAVTGPNAIAAIAAAALAARLLPHARSIAAVLPRIAATAGIIVALTSALPTFAALAVGSMKGAPDKPKDNDPRRSCTSAATLAPVARLPRGTIANVFDMGPALIVHTPHSVMAGPYHRTPSMITDSIRIWRAGDAEARAIAGRYGATYLLACDPAYDLVDAKRTAPDGLWARLKAGKTPDWLQTVPLPDGSPLRLYRIKG